MDLGPRSLSLVSAVVMVCLLGASRCSAGDECRCPEIPPCPDAQPPEERCHPVGARYRYKCVDGKVRQAGTSNLIKCKYENHTGTTSWSGCDLKCIDDPNRSRPTAEAATPVHTPSAPDPVSTSSTSVSTSSTIISTSVSTSSTIVSTRSTSVSTSSVSSTRLPGKATTARTTVRTSRTTASSTSAPTGAPRGTLDPLLATPEAGAKRNVGTTGISFASLLVIVVFVSVGVYCYIRRKRRIPPKRSASTDMDENEPMNSLP